MRKAVSILAAVLLGGVACSGVGPFSEGAVAGEISVSPGQVVLGAIGGQRQLSVTDGDGTALPPGNGVVWRSTNSSIAMVDASGMVTAVGDGETTITASLGDREASAGVTVAAVIKTVIEVTVMDQGDPDPSDNRVETTITVVAP